MDGVRVRTAGAVTWRKWDPGVVLIGSIDGSSTVRGRKVREALGHRWRQVAGAVGEACGRSLQLEIGSKIVAE